MGRGRGIPMWAKLLLMMLMVYGGVTAFHLYGFLTEHPRTERSGNVI